MGRKEWRKKREESKATGILICRTGRILICWNQFFRTPTGLSNVLNNTQQHIVQDVPSKRNHPLPRSLDQNLRVTLRSSPCHMILP